jgi:15-cis-phytoene desaturase
MPKRVVVLGAGVGGLTAAHELAQRGYAVTVYERMNAFGGKARSIPKPNSGIQQRQDLPGEHGFRFFPGFYRHLIDTMRRIPFHHGDNVAGNLVAATQSMLARFDSPPLVGVAGFPRTWEQLKTFIHQILQGNGVSFAENLHFLRCLLVMATSSMKRVDKEYDWIPYWTFIDAEHHSKQYQELLGEGLTRSLVAMKPELGSTRTIATVFCQMIYPMLNPIRHADRLLCAPTDIVWIFPWVSYLMTLGVQYQTETLACAFDAYPDAPRLQNITLLKRRGYPDSITLPHGRDFDYAISAIPVDGMAKILTTPAGKEFLKRAPGLEGITELETRWMNGVQFYLKQDIPLVRGHILYVSTPWALTAISQKQFWQQFELTTSGDGTTRGVLSVDISEWTKPGIEIKKKACDCTHEEIATEVWAQLKRSHNVNGQKVLPEEVPEYFMDDCISPDHVVDPFAKFDQASSKNPYGDRYNLEPLFINTVGSNRFRPQADFGFDNFFLASDYVRTYTDLATMEGANEAARRAVNALLERDGSSARRARVWPLHQPWYLQPWQALDAWRFRRGLPNLFSSPEMRLQPEQKQAEERADTEAKGTSA